MRSIVLGMLLMSGSVSAQERWARYNEVIRWEESIEKALERAAKEKKPVLFFQLVGDLDKEGC